MTFKAFLLATSAAAVFATASGVCAQTVHPVTGEALSDDQTSTYRVLDQPPSIYPGLAEDVEGAHVSRNLFEGVMNQDADGKLLPGAATGFTVSDDGMVYRVTLRPEAV